jgi:membrane associated rhomboid family serine protease
VAAIALIVATVLGFALASAGESRLAQRCHAVEYGLIPFELTHPGVQLTDPWCQPQPGADEHAGHDHPRGDPGLTADAPAWVTPLTAPFVHSGIGALLATLLFLWALAPALERRIGAPRVLGLYVAGALASAAALVALSPALPIVTVGASGAVAALLGGCAVACRRTRLTSLELPLAAVAAAWVAAQVLLYLADAAQPAAGAGGDVAYLAPAGGLLAGALLTRLIASKESPWPASAPPSSSSSSSSPSSSSGRSASPRPAAPSAAACASSRTR